MTLTGKRILLGITGGIAAYKAAELTRLLVKDGADVRIAMTEAAVHFIGTATLQALSSQPVWTAPTVPGPSFGASSRARSTRGTLYGSSN